MTLKRIFLIGLTAIALLIIGTDLVESFSKPQFNSRLALYESDLRLHLAELRTDGSDDTSVQLKKMVEESTSPIIAAATVYQESRGQVQSSLKTIAAQLETANTANNANGIALAKTEQIKQQTKQSKKKQRN